MMRKAALLLSLLASLCVAVVALAQGQQVTLTASPTAQNSLELQYTLPVDGFVSLAIDNAQGVRVRNLCGAAPRKAGANVEVWDGLDDAGNPVPAGTYRWRMLRHTGVGLEYQMSYANPGNPPWATKEGTGGWSSDHTDPSVVLETGVSMVIGAPMAEAGWNIIGLDDAGKKLWGLKNRYAFGDTLVNIASDGRYLYVASEQNPQPLMHYYKKLAHGVLFRYDLQTQRLTNMGGHDEVELTETLGNNVCGLALIGDTAYVALTRENRIVAVSIATGTVAPDKEIALNAPRALAAEKGGTLLVLSEARVLRVHPTTKQAAPVISTGLEKTMGICVDQAGAIYISDQGTHQVKVFTAAGQFVRAIGTPGGRALRGKMDIHGMLNPFGVTIDKRGRLWVAEDDDKPKRYSVWDTTTGQCVQQFIGPPHYGALQGCVTEFDKTMAFAEGVQYQLDWDKKTYTPLATVGRVLSDEDLFSGAGVRRVFRRDGRLLTASDTHVQVIGELRDGVLHPLAAVGEIDELTRRMGLHRGPLQRKIDELTALDPKLKGFPVCAFIWTDANGDGKAQDAEFVWKPGLKLGGYWGQAIGADLTVYMPSTNTGQIYRLPVTGWNAHGAPQYTFESAQVYPISKAEYIAPAPDGKTLVVNSNPLSGYDIATGARRWVYPNRWPTLHASHTADVPAPGRIIGPLMITGFAPVGGAVGTLFAMNGNLGEQYILTDDGFYVTAVLHDWRFARVQDMYTVPDETFGGYFWRDEKTGDVFLQSGKTEYRLYKVTGLESIRRHDGTLTVSNAMADAAQQLSAAATAPRQDVKKVRVTKLDAPMPVTADLAALPKSLAFTEVVADENNKFRFALAYDEKNLYMVYDVTDETPLVNTGRTGRLMFKSGDCVDLMLSVNPKASELRKQGEAGDFRLLFTVRDRKPLTVLYRQKDPTRNWPVAFLSPTSAYYFGGVYEYPEDKVPMAIARREKGYVLTATFPLAELGLKPQDGLVLSGDVGVIYGSETDDSVRLRLYWSNKATAITSDVPSEAALAPNHWGRLEF